MKHLLATLMALLVAASASAEVCVEKTETYEGKPVGVETCVAPVDDVIKTNVDGYLQIHYTVRYHGQRLVVEDPLARTDYAIGQQICFMVGRHEEPSDARYKGFRALYAIVIESKQAIEGCSP